MKKVCIIAQFPPPIHGLSKAVETMYNSYLREKYIFNKVNMTNNKKFIINFLKLLFSRDDLYYLTMAQTKGGNFRDLLILYLLKLKRKRTIVHLHGGYFRRMLETECGDIQQSLNRYIIKRLQGAIVLGESLVAIFEGLIDESRIFTVENCVDDKYLLGEMELKKKLNQTKSKKTLNILYLSNFIESKGYKDVLEVAKLCKQRKISNFKFVFAGVFFNCESEAEFFDIINSNDLASLVEYRGFVQGKEKLSVLNECDVFMLLTRYPKEGQPISVLEAMGNGMAIITTNHAGVPDIVSENENGYMFQYNDYEGILEKLNNIKCRRDILIQIAMNNRNKILRNFTEEKYLEKLDQIFAKV